ncbi:MAG: ABC transporter permease [Anaerolineae bacterium]|nr:ABC transporter permease [Anaerolineae bacterium]
MIAEGFQPGRKHSAFRIPHSALQGASPLLVWGVVIVLAMSAVALLGYCAAPHDPTAMDIASRLRPPDAAHPLGTDQYGRDILSRVMGGAGIALSVGAVAVGIGLGGGVVIGAVAGFYGGLLGEVLMRLMDALFAFPAILLAIAVVGALGPGHVNAMLAIGVVNVPIFARLTRASVLAVREEGYVEAARSVGGTDWHILWRHILPNGLAPLLVQASVSFATAILSEASLSYLGLGTQPPLPSWGRMLEEARLFMDRGPWLAIFPGLAIGLTVLGFNFLGDGLRDHLDPHRR